MTADAERLAQIEARLDAATPGPWHLDTLDDVVSLPDTDGCEWDVASTGVTCPMPGIPRHADADLIVNAPADLRWLLDRLREATKGRPPKEHRCPTCEHCYVLEAAEQRAENAERIARLAEESEQGWRRDADEAHVAIARVEALAEKFEHWPSSPSLSIAAQAIRATLEAVR